MKKLTPCKIYACSGGLLLAPINAPHLYYRAMQCIARTMLSQDVRPSVCPSVTRRYSVKTVTQILKLFHRWVATPFQSNTRGCEKSGFSTNVSLYLRNHAR